MFVMSATGAVPQRVFAQTLAGQAAAPKPAPFPTAFPAPIKSYDVHVYFQHEDPEQTTFARNLREEIIEMFPHLKTFTFHARPVGPHPIGMFETDLMTPAHFAEFVPWISLARGDLPVLVHPNTGRVFADHVVHGAWFGERQPLDEEFLKTFEAHGRA